MSGPPYVFSYASSHGLCLEPMPMEQSIEPEIKRSVSPTAIQNAWDWNAFIPDRNKFFYGYSAVDSIVPGTVMPCPSPYFQRPGSPSCAGSASTCSSAMSPPRESDYNQMGSPMATAESLTTPHFDPWNSHSQLFQFTGLADGLVGGVSLGEIWSGGSIGAQDDSIQVHGFPTIPSRTCSMSSDESAVDSQYSMARQSTPDTPIVKDEIWIPDPPEHDPISDSEVEEESTDESEAPCVTCEPLESYEEDEEDDDDDDYKPTQSKRPSPKSSRNPAGHKRRSTTSTTASEVKRAKFTHGDTLVIRSGTKLSSQGTQGQFVCPDCPKIVFKDQSGLDAHTKKQHTRPFICVFEFAGCVSTFASKNEWKRHCASQHLALQYWVCQQDACAKVSNKYNPAKKQSSSSSSRSNRAHVAPATAIECTANLPNGTIFNRKDLYTQHLRRMHVPTHLKKQVKLKKSIDEWEQRQRKYQDEALRTRCHLPTHMTCPSQNCNARFDGQNAWDDRMEHVAKHLEKSATGAEPPLRFGAGTDATLVDWASNPAVGILHRAANGTWTLQNPLKICTGRAVARAQTAEDSDEDVDAEGEDDIELA